MSFRHNIIMSNEPIVTTSAYRGRRTFLVGPWHYCARCGSRVKISEMAWQRGVLVCKTFDCQDYGVAPFIGQREEIITNILDPNALQQELQPDPKLVSPNDSGTDGNDDIVF